MKEKILGGIFGLCIADALGVPVEFQSRDELAREPVTDVRGYGTHNQPAGTWSDDTSMTLALLDSLVHGLNYFDIMQGFRGWFYKDKYTPHNEVFDVGNACRIAIMRFAGGTPPLLCGGSSEYDNGNGSLMRILPLVFYLHTHYGDDFMRNEKAVEIMHNVSALTHAHRRSQIACGIYLSIAQKLMSKMRLNFAVEFAISQAWDYYNANTEYADELMHYVRLHAAKFKDLSENEIRSSGYVVDTLEAAIWCLLNSNSYESCVLKAVNLGEDTDTVAAVAGGLAGMYYGYESIPNQWKEKIAKADYIAALCDALDNTLIRTGFEKISKYIPYFETADAVVACRWKKSRKMEDGSFSMPYPVYENELLQFIDDASNSGLLDYAYIDTIKKHGYELNNSVANAIEIADIELAKAILTSYIRQERFCSGLWGRAVKDGVFLALLKRIRHLLTTN